MVVLNGTCPIAVGPKNVWFAALIYKLSNFQQSLAMYH